MDFVRGDFSRDAITVQPVGGVLWLERCLSQIKARPFHIRRAGSVNKAR